MTQEPVNAFASSPNKFTVIVNAKLTVGLELEVLIVIVWT